MLGNEFKYHSRSEYSIFDLIKSLTVLIIVLWVIGMALINPIATFSFHFSTFKKHFKLSPTTHEFSNGISFSDQFLLCFSLIFKCLCTSPRATRLRSQYIQAKKKIHSVLNVSALIKNNRKLIVISKS
jgi:hypothetical protein